MKLDKTSIANNFNNFFIGPNLANKIDTSIYSYVNYLTRSNTIINNTSFNDEEFITGFKSLKSNKATGYDNISSNVIKHIYDGIKMHVFNKSIRQGIIPDKLKIAKVTPVFKSGEESYVNNYTSISILPTFSKFLERIMYNRLY